MPIDTTDIMRGQVQDESRLPATLRDLDYLERRVQELEARIAVLEDRGRNEWT